MYLTTTIRKNEVCFSLKPIKTSYTKTELLIKFLFKNANQKQNSLYFNKN
jgi:hypothetical protein